MDSHAPRAVGTLGLLLGKFISKKLARLLLRGRRRLGMIVRFSVKMGIGYPQEALLILGIRKNILLFPLESKFGWLKI